MPSTPDVCTVSDSLRLMNVPTPTPSSMQQALAVEIELNKKTA